jgi:hypothetical protein
MKKCIGYKKKWEEWSNMIGYKMGSSSIRVYTMGKTSLVEHFKHGWKKDMATNMATLFARGVMQSPSFLGNLKPSYKKLDLHDLQITPT